MKTKHLVISIGIISSLLLTACGNSDSTTTTSTTPLKEGNKIYENDNFSLQIPMQWEAIDKSSFTSNVPAETIIGFRNHIKSDIFTANINIAQKEVDSTMPVKDFAKSSLEITRNNLIGYQLVNEKEGKNTYSTEFEGKKSASEQIIHFKQLHVINNSTAYTITGAYLPNEDESVVNAIGEMMESFMLSN